MPNSYGNLKSHLWSGLYLVNDTQEGKYQHVTIEKTFSNPLSTISAFYEKGVENLLTISFYIIR